MGVRVIYADVLFLMNFIVDFLCLYITRALLSLHAPLWKTVLSAAFGGAYAVVWAAAPYVPAYYLIPAHLAFAFFMTFLAFGRRGFARICAACAVFVLSAALSGGVLGAAFSLSGGGYMASGGVYAEISPAFLTAVAAFSVGACYVYGVLCRKRIAAVSAEARIFVDGKPYSAKLFVDTGCHVLDPVTGEQVVIVSGRVFGKEKPRVTRLIPFSTAAGSTVLDGFRPQKTVINGDETDVIIAISGEDEYYGGCDGLVPPTLACKRRKNGKCS